MNQVITSKKAPEQVRAFANSLIVRGDSVKEFTDNLRTALSELSLALQLANPPKTEACPHCGDELSKHSADIADSDETVYWVTCNNCGYQEE